MEWWWYNHNGLSLGGVNRRCLLVMDPGQFHWLLYCKVPMAPNWWLLSIFDLVFLPTFFSVAPRSALCEGSGRPSLTHHFLIDICSRTLAYALFGNYTTFKAQLLLVVVQEISKVSSSEIVAPQFTQDRRLSVIPGFSYFLTPHTQLVTVLKT